MELNEQFTRARDAGVPLVVITEPDPAATIYRIGGMYEERIPLLRWDCQLGIQAINETARAWVSGLGEAIKGSHDIRRALAMAHGIPEDGIIFFINAHMFLHDAQTIQAFWNLRDGIKPKGAMAVVLCPQINLPPELRDFVVLDEPLPDVEEIKKIITRVYSETSQAHDNKLPKLKDELLSKAAETLTGMSAFSCEQSTAMGITSKGLDRSVLWSQKKQSIKQVKGLSVDEDTLTLSDMGGTQNLIEFGHRLFNGLRPPTVVVRVEEIEKKVPSEEAGGVTRSSDIGMDALDVYLNAMEDNEWSGILCVGHPGTGKSYYSKCLANTFGALSLAQDINATRSKYVGESEMYFRENIKALKAMGGKRVFFVATANSIKSIPAALRRRFWMGVYFFDLPTPEEQDSIWRICLDKRKLKFKPNEFPDYTNWTGAEIRNCSEFSLQFRCTPKEAGEYIVPIYLSQSETIKALREAADGRFLSASYKGVYKMDKKVESKERKIRI